HLLVISVLEGQQEDAGPVQDQAFVGPFAKRLLQLLPFFTSKSKLHNPYLGAHRSSLPDGLGEMIPQEDN
ncbi:MAG: hypothetical protein QXK93_07560, partial [Candidatus Bathyarchaeia archaeon]